MKLVYIAGPFSAPDRAGVEENIDRAVSLGIEVAKLGAMPVIPHANTRHPEFETVQPYWFWIEGTTELMRRCDALITVEGWEQSNGSQIEVREMARLERPVFRELASLKEWIDA